MLIIFIQSNAIKQSSVFIFRWLLCTIFLDCEAYLSFIYLIFLLPKPTIWTFASVFKVQGKMKIFTKLQNLFRCYSLFWLTLHARFWIMLVITEVTVVHAFIQQFDFSTQIWYALFCSLGILWLKLKTIKYHGPFMDRVKKECDLYMLSFSISQQPGHNASTL